MKTFDFWVVWLKLASIFIIIFGIVIALLNQSDFFASLFAKHINLVFWQGNAVDNSVTNFMQWIYGVLGATLVLLGVLVYAITKNALAKKEKWASKSIFLGIILWFMLDTPISLYFQVYVNVAINIFILLIVLLPLFFTKKYLVD